MLFSINIHIFWTHDFQQKQKLFLWQVIISKENHIYCSAILNYTMNCLLLMANIFKTPVERFSINFYFAVLKDFKIRLFLLSYNISCLSIVGHQPVISQGFWKLVSEEAD